MAKTSTPCFTQSIKHTITSFVDSDSTNLKTIATAGLDDSRITQIAISSDDVFNIAFFYINDSTTESIISYCPIPANSGTNGTNDIVYALSSSNFLFRKLDNNANPFFELGTGCTLKMKLNTAVTSAKEIKVIVTQEDY